MSTQNFPPGWDEARIREVIAHYENQTEDEQFVDIESTLEGEGLIMVAVPTALLAEVRALLARSQTH